jgi:hypothetical protein
MSQEGHPFSALPTLDNNFPCYGGQPLITRVSAVIGQLVPVESGGPSLLVWAIFLFIDSMRNLKATVYGGSTLVTKVV